MPVLLMKGFIGMFYFPKAGETYIFVFKFRVSPIFSLVLFILRISEGI